MQSRGSGDVWDGDFIQHLATAFSTQFDIKLADGTKLFSDIVQSFISDGKSSKGVKSNVDPMKNPSEPFIMTVKRDVDYDGVIDMKVIQKEDYLIREDSMRFTNSLIEKGYKVENTKK